MTLTLLDETRAVSVDATVAPDGIRLPPDAVAHALGWEVKPQGLCQGDRCVPLPAAGVTPDGIDLAVLAQALGRPLAVDVEVRVACVGVAADERARALRSLDAPDFTLPDVDGRPHGLADFRGRKILLLAWASW